jgi:hypothetical protein
MNPPPPSPAEMRAWVRTRWRQFRERGFDYGHRWMWYFFGAQMLFVLSGFLAFWIPPSVGTSYQWSRLAIPFAMFGVLLLFAIRRSRRIKRCEFKVCYACGYDLRGLDESGVCPECGRAYEIASLIRKWKGEG